MADNVRCAGRFARPQVFFNGRPVVANVTATEMQIALPCGWKGERKRRFVRGGRRLYDLRMVKPCPNCGGRVELIPAETREVAR